MLEQRYVERGFEGNLIRFLDEYDSVCVLGLPGVGKTTTAMYVYAKLKEMGKKVVYLSSDDSKTIRLIHEGKETKVRCISIKDVSRRKGEELGEALAYVVVKAISGSVLDKLSGKAREALEWIVEKFGEKKIGEKMEKVENLTIRLAIGGKEVKEVAEKLSEWFEGVFGKGLSIVKDKISEILGRVHETYLVDFLVEVAVFAMGGLAAMGIIKALKELGESEPEVEDAIVIIDDIADFDEHEIVGLVKFLKKHDVKVLLVKRLSYEEYMEVMDFMEDKTKPIDIDSILFKGAKDYFDLDLRKRIFPMGSAERKEFEEIIKANGYDFEDFDLLYRASAGIVSIGIWLLELGFKASDMRKIVGEVDRIFSHHEISKAKGKEKRKKLESNRVGMFRAIIDIYEKLCKENVCYIALLFNEVAEDELIEFCEDRRISGRFGIQCGTRFLKTSIVESCEEKWVNGMRKVYSVKGEWEKLAYFVESLCSTEGVFEGERKRIEGDIKVIREVLLDIYDKEHEESGEATGRMVYFALDNLKWLHDRGVKKLKSLFNWSSIALKYLPGFIEKVLRLALNSLESLDSYSLPYALMLARDLAEFGRLMFDRYGYLATASRLIKFLNRVEDDDETCYWKALTLSALSKSFAYFRLPYEDLLRKAERYAENSGSLKDLARVALLIDEGEIYVNRDPKKAVEILSECLKIVERLRYEDSYERAFKLFGGSPKEKFEDQLREYKRIIYYNLGWAYLAFDLSESERSFVKSIKLAERFEDELATKSRIGRVRVIRDYEFEFEVEGERYDFERLWKSCLKRWYRVHSEWLAYLCAEYLISLIVRNHLDKKDKGYLEFLEFNEKAKALFYGLSYIMGVELKELKEVVKILNEFDVRWFSLLAQESDRAKIMVEMLYEYAFDEKYEAVKRAIVEEFGTLAITIESSQALARVMFFYIIGDLKSARDVAFSVSNLLSPTLAKLFRELCEGIEEEIKAKSDAEREEAREKVKRAFVKLFYYHV